MALFVLAAIFGLSIATTVRFAKVRRGAALLMLPYLTWLCFAGFLNYKIIELNPEAEALVPREGSADIEL